MDVIGLLDHIATSIDNDEKYMALKDLRATLKLGTNKTEGEWAVPSDVTRRLAHSIAILCLDPHGDVQELAAKCLAAIILEVQEPVMEAIVNGFFRKVTKESEDADVDVLSKRTLALAALAELCRGTQTQKRLVILHRVTARIHRILVKEKDTSTKNEVLSLLEMILRQHSAVLVHHHKQLLGILASELKIDHSRSKYTMENKTKCAAISKNNLYCRQALKKISESISLLGQHADMHLVKDLVQKLCDELPSRVEACTEYATFVCMSCLSRLCGPRLSSLGLVPRMLDLLAR